MNNVTSGIKDGLAMLANAISNIHAQQMILPQEWGNLSIIVIRAIKCQSFLHLNHHLTLPLISGLGIYIHTKTTIHRYLLRLFVLVVIFC